MKDKKTLTAKVHNTAKATSKLLREYGIHYTWSYNKRDNVLSITVYNYSYICPTIIDQINNSLQGTESSTPVIF